MKLNIIALVIILFGIQNSFAEKSTLISAKVFLSGAELTHSSILDLKEGENTIEIEGVANEIYPNTINVKPSKDYRIISKEVKTDYINYEDIPSTKKLLVSIDSLEKLIKINKSKLDNKWQLLEILKINSDMTKSNTKINIQDIATMLQFVEKEQAKINKEKIELTDEIENLNKQLEKFKNQLAIGNKTIFNNKIKLVLIAYKTGKYNCNFEYFTQSASWQPKYDVNFTGLDKDLNFKLKADVSQQSGFDWNKIDLTLSTKYPEFNLEKPTLEPMFIDFINQAVVPGNGGFVLRGSRSTETLMKVDGKDVSNEFLGGFAAKYGDPMGSSLTKSFIQSENLISKEYDYNQKADIRHDDSPKSFELSNNNVKAEYKYYAVPKVSESAFLVAELPNEEVQNLLSSSINIYYEDSYINQSYLNINTTKKIKITINKDENIICKKETIRDFKENTFLSKDVERAYQYKMIIKNNKKENIKLFIEDQLPIPKHEEIEVKNVELSGGNINDETKIITWEKEIKPNESQEFYFKYLIRYPENKPIIIGNE